MWKPFVVGYLLYLRRGGMISSKPCLTLAAETRVSHVCTHGMLHSKRQILWGLMMTYRIPDSEFLQDT